MDEDRQRWPKFLTARCVAGAPGKAGPFATPGLLALLDANNRP
jgi:hypothetical protein